MVSQQTLDGVGVLGFGLPYAELVAIAPIPKRDYVFTVPYRCGVSNVLERVGEGIERLNG
jgi:hypothetical protein